MSHQLRRLDISKINTESMRRKKRQKFLLWSSGPLCILLGAVIWLFLPYYATTQASNAIGYQHYDDASRWLQLLGTNSHFELYKRSFNQAITQTHRKQYDEAAESFRAAIAAAPESEKCMIRVQLVLSTELAGDDAAASENTQATIVAYTKALSDIAAHAECFKDQKQLIARISEKLAATINQMNKKRYQDTNQTAKDSQKATQEPSKDQLEQLEKLQNEGQLGKQESERSNGSFDVDVDKPW